VLLAHSTTTLNQPNGYVLIFISSPNFDPYCLSGKLSWLQRRFGKQFGNYAFVRQKHLLANQNAILVDDSKVHVDEFIKAGGKAVLFPMPWNKSHVATNKKVNFVLDAFKSLTGDNSNCI